MYNYFYGYYLYVLYNNNILEGVIETSIPGWTLASGN